ncbi:MAG: acyl-CoA/acyl-ACP dehydrogenase [Chloroflexota bacterium]|nr:acyl-CoA/acyl-ACP dehydrogenase [Chloroflexota bacterium]MDE2685451.1 acyl-CoA/acyl-ACP dehydrogenase [Chloroflexota bacterium]
MNVLPNEEELMVKNAAREFLEAECPPSLARAIEQDERGYSVELWEKMASLGWFGISLPESHGGGGLPVTYLGLILEECGRAIAPVPFHSTATAALAVSRHGSAEQQQSILPRAARGDLIMTWAVQEQDPRLRADAIQCRAEVDGDSLVISGIKHFVDNFSAAELMVTAVRTAAPSDDNAGITLVIVPTNSAGITETRLTTLAKDSQSKLTMDGVRVPLSNVIGEVNQGWPATSDMLDIGTALLCAQITGAARKDAEMAIDYAKNRVAFGRPIAGFQSIQHLCADMIVWTDGAQLLTYEALWKLDSGLPFGVEVSQAKAFTNDKCQATVRSSQQIHGGIGFMMEFDLHLWYRRVTAWTMRLGTSFEHRARVARALLDQPGEVRLGMNLQPVG